MKIFDETGKPWRVMVELPNCPELGLLGIKNRNLRCAIRETDQAGKFLASVDELKGTKIKPKRFSFTVSKRYISQNAISATVTCTSTGRPFNGRGFEKNGIVYLIDLSHFVQVRAVCSDQNALATEWEINSVRFSSRFDAQSVVVEEDVIHVAMPVNLRVRYVLGEKLTTHFPTLSEVIKEVRSKVDSISDIEARKCIARFIEPMAWAYMYAFNPEFMSTESEELAQPEALPQAQVQSAPQPAVAQTPSEPVAIPAPALVIETQPEQVEVAVPEEPIFFQATGTDDEPIVDAAAQVAFDINVAAMQAAAMKAESMSRHQKNRSRGK